jgi:hypothetical protein
MAIPEEVQEKALLILETERLVYAFFASIKAQRKPGGSLSNAKKMEIYTQITDITDKSSDITKLLGDVAESSHSLLEFSEAQSKALGHGGGIGGIIAGTLGLITIPLLCALEKRLPKPIEIGQMALSAVVLILGSLALAAVGGPIAVGAFVITISALGLGRTALGFYHEWRERKALEKEVDSIEEEIEGLKNKAHEEYDSMLHLKNQMIEAMANPKRDEARIEQLKSDLKIACVNLDKTIHELEDKNLVYATKNTQLIELQEKRTNRWELAKKGIYASAGIMTLIGACLMLTPAAPIGMIFMLTTASIIAATAIGSFTVNQIKNYQARQAQKETEHALIEANELQDESASLQHNLSHSSMYHIASDFAPDNIKEALQKVIENSNNPTPEELHQNESELTQEVQPSSPQIEEDEDEGEGETPKNSEHTNNTPTQ